MKVIFQILWSLVVSLTITIEDPATRTNTLLFIICFLLINKDNFKD